MRKLAILAPICALLFLAQFASAQEGDIMFGGGTLLSPNPSSSALAAGNISEKGGTYLSIAGDVVGNKRSLGLMIENSWRASKASYFTNET